MVVCREWVWDMGHFIRPMKFKRFWCFIWSIKVQLWVATPLYITTIGKLCNEFSLKELVSINNLFMYLLTSEISSIWWQILKLTCKTYSWTLATINYYSHRFNVITNIFILNRHLNQISPFILAMKLIFDIWGMHIAPSS